MRYNFGTERSPSRWFRSNFGIRERCHYHSMYFSHLGVFLISVKPLTTETAENKTTSKFCKTTVIMRTAYKGPKPQSVLLSVWHVKLFRSMTNFQASPPKQSSLRSKDRLPNHTVVLIAAGIERCQTVRFQFSKSYTKTRTASNSSAVLEVFCPYLAF